LVFAEGKTAVPTEADEKAESMPKDDIAYVDAAKRAEEEE